MERWIWGDILVDKLWGEGDSGSWLQESDTAVEYKSELLEVCSCEGHPCLKSDQMAKQDRILDGTLWPQDRWHYRENGSAWAAEFLIIRTGKLAAACECGSMVSAQFAIKCEPWQDRGTNLCEGDVQRTETQWPYSFPWEGQCRCAHNQVTSLHVGALQVAGPLWPTSPPGNIWMVCTAGVCRVWHTQNEDGYSLRVYWRDGSSIFQLQVWRSGATILIFIL